MNLDDAIRKYIFRRHRSTTSINTGWEAATALRYLMARIDDNIRFSMIHVAGEILRARILTEVERDRRQLRLREWIPAATALTGESIERSKLWIYDRRLDDGRRETLRGWNIAFRVFVRICDGVCR